MFLAILWFIGKLLDHISTQLVLQTGGIELNPINRWVLTLLGPVGSIVVYICIALLFYVVSKLFKGDRFVQGILVFLVIVNFLLASANFLQFLFH